MGVTRELTIDDTLRIEVRGVDFDGIQFTDEVFEGEVVVTNTSDRPVTGQLTLVQETNQTLGLDKAPMSQVDIDLDLGPGEQRVDPVSGNGLVAGSGSPILIGVEPPELDREGDAITLESGAGFAPIASLVFWDRDLYRVNHLWPRRAQYVSVVFALLSALFAALTVFLSL